MKDPDEMTTEELTEYLEQNGIDAERRSKAEDALRALRAAPAHALLGVCVSVRNAIDHHGLNGMCVLDDDFRIKGAGRYVEGKIVEVHPCWTGPGCGYVRVEYPARYFGGTMPRYGNVAMRNLRSPNSKINEPSCHNS